MLRSKRGAMQVSAACTPPVNRVTGEQDVEGRVQVLERQKMGWSDVVGRGLDLYKE